MQIRKPQLTKVSRKLKFQKRQMCEKLQCNSSTRFEDGDTPILYCEKFDEYGLKINDGGSSSILIAFCPWCGQKLPDSKREKWFDEMERLGMDPWNGDIPKKYLSNEWFQTNTNR
jgi:hypothetical protein